MNDESIRRANKLDFLILLPIVALAFYLAFIPHQSYPYSVHVDEWVHLAHSKAMLQAGSTTYIDPFFGESTIGPTSAFSQMGPHLYTGYYLFWGVFQQISGLSWLTIFKYFPAIIFVITVLSAYILGRREGFGLEAALFTCLIPTTIGILGPGFMVPVAFGLLFIPLALFLVLNFRTIWSYLALFLLTCFLLLIHAATAVGLVIILVPFILLNLKDNFKHSLGIMLALGIPFLAPFPWIFNLLLPTAKSLFSPQLPLGYVEIPQIIKTYGYLPVLFCILGTFLLAMRGGKKGYGLILSLLALTVMLATFFTLHYGVPIMYYRGLMYMMLMMGIVAGAGLMGVRNFRLPTRLAVCLKAPLIRQNVGNILCLALISLTLAIAIPARQDADYYHMIDERDYRAFVWIRDNVNESYQKAILDPWKATAFTAITGKNIDTRIHSYPKPEDEKVYEFLGGGCQDTALMREKGISIVYTREQVNNPDLIKVRENIYLLKEAGVP